MSTQTQGQRDRAPAVETASSGPPPLRRGRTHEALGPRGDVSAARVFCAAQAGRVVRQAAGPVLWILSPLGREAEPPGVLDPYGLAAFFDPGRLILAEARDRAEALWALEEALRSGAASVVAAELSRPPDLTESRRLQLAAEAGGAAARPKGAGDGATPDEGPLGVVIAPEPPRPISNAAETRWRCAFAPAWAAGARRPVWRWELLKNKRGVLGAWDVAWTVSEDAFGAGAGSCAATNRQSGSPPAGDMALWSFAKHGTGEADRALNSAQNALMAALMGAQGA